MIDEPLTLGEFLDGAASDEERVVKPLTLSTVDGESHITIVIDYPEGYAIDAAKALATVATERSIGDFVLRAAEDEDASAVALLHDNGLSLDELRSRVEAEFVGKPALSLDDVAHLF